MSENHHANSSDDVNGVKDLSLDPVVKRKKNPISINDYFTKRRKMSSNGCLAAGKGDQSQELEKKRELLASAAEKRLATHQTEAFAESEAEKRLSCITKDSAMQTLSHGSGEHDEPTETNLKLSSQTKVDIPSDFNRAHLCADVMPKLTPTDNHTIMFRPHVMTNKVPRPFPDSYKDIWDKHHVRMPCSSENLYPTTDKKIQKRWELIEATLLQPFQTSQDLEEAILVYNHHYRDKWNFESWHSYCNIQLNADEREELFGSLLPNMVNLALQLPTIVTTSPRLLQRGVSHSITFSQKQIACMLCNAFFCTYPRRNSLKNSEYSSYPDINFSKLFRGIKDVVNDVKTEKLKIVLNYFKRVLNEMPTGTVTYQRVVLTEKDTPAWEQRTDEFRNLYATSEGSIEDNGEGMLQVDFANRMIGGGVVGEGCVQEEIRFLICPELILARLFTEKMEPNECLLVTGVERYSSYSGYAQTFKYKGSYMDFTPRDRWSRRYTQVVAIDAHVFHCFSDQLKTVSMKRELNKAYCGFQSQSQSVSQTPAVASGNWGCGAFGGDVYLKSLLQLMAAAVAKRDMIYFTFGDETFAKELRDMHEFLLRHNISVCKLWHLLVCYGKEVKTLGEHQELYPYLRRIYNDYTCETDDETSSCNEDNPLEIRGIPCEIPDDMEPISPEYVGDTP